MLRLRAGDSELADSTMSPAFARSPYLSGHVVEKLAHTFEGTSQLRAGRMVSPVADLDNVSTDLLQPGLDGLQPGGHGFGSAQIPPALEGLVVAPPSAHHAPPS